MNDNQLEWITDIQNLSGPKYRAIADMIETAINKKQLKQGDQLPPQRELAYQLGVTLGTITRAYGELERRGLLVGETGRGSFIKSKHTKNNPYYIPHGEKNNAANFRVSLPVHVDINDILRSTIEDITHDPNFHELMIYQNEQGMQHHRKIIADFFSLQGQNTQPDNTIITVGAQHAILTALMATAKHGDYLLCDHMTFPGILNSATEIGMKLVGIENDAHGMCPQKLEDAIITTGARHVFLVPDLSNPIGVTMPEKRRREIADICQRHHVFVLEDHCYSHNIQPENRICTISSLIPDLCFGLNSFSKFIIAGMRVGSLHCPPDYVNAACSFIKASVSMAPPLNVEIICRWITDGIMDDIIEYQRDELTHRNAIALDILSDFNIVTEKGAPYIWIELHGWNADYLTALLERENIFILPARIFTVDKSNSIQAIRLTLGGSKSREDITRACKKIHEVLSMPPPMSDIYS